MTFAERKIAAKLPKEEDGATKRHVWLLHRSFTGNWQNAELSFQGCLSTPTANWSKMRKTGICYSHSLCPSGWWERTEYEWKRVKREALQKMKTRLKRQLVQYNQRWHKYWMNANKECRLDVKRNGSPDTPESPGFHSTLSAQGYP